MCRVWESWSHIKFNWSYLCLTARWPQGPLFPSLCGCGSSERAKALGRLLTTFSNGCLSSQDLPVNAARWPGPEFCSTPERTLCRCSSTCSDCRFEQLHRSGRACPAQWFLPQGLLGPTAEARLDLPPPPGSWLPANLGRSSSFIPRFSVLNLEEMFSLHICWWKGLVPVAVLWGDTSYLLLPPGTPPGKHTARASVLGGHQEGPAPTRNWLPAGIWQSFLSSASSYQVGGDLWCLMRWCG